MFHGIKKKHNEFESVMELLPIRFSGIHYTNDVNCHKVWKWNNNWRPSWQTISHTNPHYIGFQFRIESQLYQLICIKQLFYLSRAQNTCMSLQLSTWKITADGRLWLPEINVTNVRLWNKESEGRVLYCGFTSAIHTLQCTYLTTYYPRYLTLTNIWRDFKWMDGWESLTSLSPR